MNGYGNYRGVYSNPYTNRSYGPYLSATQGFLNAFMQHRQMMQNEQYRQSLMDLQKRQVDIREREVEAKEASGGLTGVAGYLFRKDPKLFDQYLNRQVTGKVALDVNIPALEKGTKGFLEKEIINLDSSSAMIERALETMEDDFLTYGGKIQAGAQRFGEKLGAKIDTKFLQRRSIWMATAQRNLLDYRHQITGVAGKPEEYADIAKAAPDPERNSPTEFKAKAEELLRIGNKLTNRYKVFLFSGIKNPSAEQLISIPYEAMPEKPITRQEAIDIAQQYNIGMGHRLFGDLLRPIDENDNDPLGLGF